MPPVAEVALESCAGTEPEQTVASAVVIVPALNATKLICVLVDVAWQPLELVTVTV